MGDHRASIKIEMEFYGIKDNCDMWINYWPEGCCNIDRRVTEFIQKVYKRGMEKYEESMEKYYEEENRERIKKEELAKLNELKKKYPDA